MKYQEIKLVVKKQNKTRFCEKINCSSVKIIPYSSQENYNTPTDGESLQPASHNRSTYKLYTSGSLKTDHVSFFLLA